MVAGMVAHRQSSARSRRLVLNEMKPNNRVQQMGSVMQTNVGHRKLSTVGARLKLTTCAGLKLTRCYSGVDYYAAVDKSTRL